MSRMQMVEPIKIVKFLLIETGTYNDQFRRSYRSTMTQHSIDNLQERIDGRTQIVPGMFGSWNNSLVVPSTEPDAQVQIVQGFGERRLRFMMEIELTNTMGQRVAEVVMGYSDHVGLSMMSNALDPNMQFVVNSVVTTRTSNFRSPMGMIQQTHVAENAHILSDDNFGGAFSPQPNFTMREGDIYSAINKLEYSAGLNPGETMYDTRVVRTNVPVKARRSSNTAASYTASILDSYRASLIGAEFGENADAIRNSAQNTLYEEALTADNFFHALTQLNEGIQTKVFTLRQLKRLDPNCDHDDVMTIVRHNPAEAIHSRGQTAYWDGRDRATQVANMLAQSVPATMADLGISVLSFTVSNDTADGQPIFQPTGAFAFGNVDLARPLEMFKYRFDTEVYRVISLGNSTQCSIAMRVDLTGESFIRVAIDGNPEVDFVVPTFCDALLSPLMTNNEGDMMNLAQGFSDVMTAVLDIPAQNHALGFNTSLQGSNDFGINQQQSSIIHTPNTQRTPSWGSM